MKNGWFLAQSAGAVEYTDRFSAEPPPPNESPGYDTKHFDDEVPVLLELWEMWSTPSLTLLQSPLWPGLVAPDRVLSIGQLEIKHGFESLLLLPLNWSFMLNRLIWNRTAFVTEIVIH